MGKTLRFIYALTIMSISLTSIASQFTQYDFLKVTGDTVKNNYGKGSNIYLRGTNIGSMFVQEAWMSATSAKDYKTTLETFTRRFGQDKALSLLHYYEDNFFTGDDIGSLKGIGCSVLRIPFSYMTFYKKVGEEWVQRSDAFDKIDWIVNECSKRGVYVILDLHGAFGSQNGQDHSGEVIDRKEDVTFFRNETLMSKTLELWRFIARHYKGNPAIAAYDTLNEPGEKAGPTGEIHWQFYDRMYKAIREEDPDHIIMMESCWGVSNLPNPTRYGWTNVIYQYHHYTWDCTDDSVRSFDCQKNGIDNLVNSVNSANYGVPTYIGEFTCFDNNRGWDYVLDKMNHAGWHWTTWNYKALGQGAWGIYHNKGWEKVNPEKTSESEIYRIWGPDSVGTNFADTGITWNHVRNYLPGTVVFADKALTESDFFFLKANINSKFVSADNYGASNLIANRDQGQEWEQYRMINNSDGTVSLFARANSHYLTAIFDDPDTNHPVKARANKIEDWERYYYQDNGDGTVSFKCHDNNVYLQADTDANGLIYARGTSVGTWEKFTLQHNGNQYEEIDS